MASRLMVPRLMAAAMLGAPLTDMVREPNVITAVEPESKVVTPHDLERIEKARIKRERKRLKRARCSCRSDMHECCDICTGYALAKLNGTLKDKE